MPASNRIAAYYASPVKDFISSDTSLILGALVRLHGHDLEIDQRNAWTEEISILKSALNGLKGTLFVEFEVPRLGSRIDAALVSGSAVVPIEFKCGEQQHRTADYNQVWDYALDLKNFHEASHNAPIFPILLPTKASAADNAWQPAAADGVRPPFRCDVKSLRNCIDQALTHATGPKINGTDWGAAAYHPTPTIIEAARALYATHSVEAISRRDAGATNLRLTSTAVEEIIERSRAKSEKSVVFVTGVPGAGKTLVGLDVATRRREKNEAHAIYLSGNHPLVAVLQEALTRDELERSRNAERKGVVLRRVQAFIQNVLHYRDEFVRTDVAPVDHIVIFDEAQRAWDRSKTSDFMRRRRRIETAFSEPEFLISYLDRHQKWAVIICLVGGGQEIHTGEVGISEWLDTIRLAGSGNSDHPFSGNSDHISSGKSGRLKSPSPGQTLAVSHSEGGDDRHAQTARDTGSASSRTQSSRGGKARRRLTRKRASRRA